MESVAVAADVVCDWKGEEGGEHGGIVGYSLTLLGSG